jgi:predicted enzyme related to lactoylglutathione lyase
MTSESHRRAVGSLRAVALDAPDIELLARFYEQLAGWRGVPDDDDEWITMDSGDGWRIGLQRATDHMSPQWPDQDRPQQAHLDFRVPDIDVAAERPSSSVPACCAATNGGTHWPTRPATRSTCASTPTTRGPP